MERQDCSTRNGPMDGIRRLETCGGADGRGLRR